MMTVLSPDNGNRGLVNMGNTCYMNSIIQCLNSTKEFRDYVLSENYLKDILANIINNDITPQEVREQLEKKLSYQLLKIFKFFWCKPDKDLPLKPKHFKEIFGDKIEIFQGSEQQDSQEALLCILDTMNNELSSKVDISIDLDKYDPDFLEFANKYLEFSNQNNQTQLDELIKTNSEWHTKMSAIIVEMNNLKKFSIITQLFQGLLHSSLTCPECKYTSNTFDPYFYLSVSIPEPDKKKEEKEEEKKKSTNINDHIKDDFVFQDQKPQKNTKKRKQLDEDIDVFRIWKKNYLNYIKDDIKYDLYNSDNNSGSDCGSLNVEDGIEDGDLFLDEEEPIDENIELKPVPCYTDAVDYQIYRGPISSINTYSSDGYAPYNNYYTNLYGSYRGFGSYSTYKKKYNLEEDIELDNTEYTLIDCLKKYTNVETLDDKNKWKCSKCNKEVNAEKRMKIWNPPKILIIHIKRFHKTENKIYKKKNLIKFPLKDLCIDEFISSNNQSHKYEIFAINNHVNGSAKVNTGIGYGHYFSYCKNSVDDKWYEFNDEKVEEIDESKLQTINAYILFYKLME